MYDSGMDYSPICYVCGEDIKENKEPFYYCVERFHLIGTDQELENDQILDALELLALCPDCIYYAKGAAFKPTYEPIQMLDIEKKELSRFAKWYTKGKGKWTSITGGKAVCSLCQKPVSLLDEYTRTEISVDVFSESKVSSEERYVLAIFCKGCSEMHI